MIIPLTNSSYSPLFQGSGEQASLVIIQTYESSNLGCAISSDNQQIDSLLKNWIPPKKTGYPLVNVYIANWKITILSIIHGKTHYFDWAIFNSFLYVYQAG